MHPVIESLADYARAVNIVLALLALGSMAFQWRAYVDANRADQFQWSALGLLVVAALVGSVETLTHHAAPGIRSWLVMVGLLWTLAAIWLERADDLRDRLRRR